MTFQMHQSTIRFILANLCLSLFHTKTFNIPKPNLSWLLLNNNYLHQSLLKFFHQSLLFIHALTVKPEELLKQQSNQEYAL